MKTIGITGGIGTGKSTVSDYIARKGYKVIDADGISRKMTEKGSPVIKTIRETFGDEFFDEQGNLNRKKMAALVFADAIKKKQLEEIITAKVIDNVKKQIKDLRHSGRYDIIFLDAPLLFESGTDKVVDCVWLVMADMDIRIDRVISRDGTSREDVVRRINNQMSDEEKASKSQEIIDNSKGKAELYKQIDRLISKYV